jgi:hypothetical protein
VTSKPPIRKHSPRIVQRPDGRWEVQCSDCQRRTVEQPPVGIGLPILNRSEAEAIARNHQQRVA